MNVRDLDTPVLVVDLDRLERNLRHTAEYGRQHGLTLTPHIKTHKSIRLALEQRALGATGITCAKLGEAEVMADGGIDSILLAYPIVGEAKLARLIDLARRVELSVALDSLEVLEPLAAMAARGGATVGVLIEVDTGTGRCGVTMGPDLITLCEAADALDGVTFRGVMTYQGHVRGTAAERDAQMHEESDRVRRLLTQLAAEEIRPECVSAASSPNRGEMHRLPGITHVRHGTYVFNDRNTLAQEACRIDECALAVAVTVVSTAVPGQLIIDAGSKTFSSDPLAGGGAGFGLCIEDPDLLLIRMNEEHGYVDRSRSGRPHRVGDRLHFIPNHVCTCVNLHDGFYVHRDGRVEDSWPVDARGRVR